MTEKLIEEMLSAVKQFNEDIIGIKIPEHPTHLSKQRTDFRALHIREELQELEEAATDAVDDAEELAEQADALLDIIYIALGGLVEMGIVPGTVFNEVHNANMKKRRGELSKRPGSQGFDAIKPEGWTPPDISAAILTTPSVLNNVSPVHLELAKLRAAKGQDYNSCVKIGDYFPLGHISYFQMMHLKTTRARSLIDVLQNGGTPNFEGLRDTLLDNLNYVTFWVEAIDKGEI